MSKTAEDPPQTLDCLHRLQLSVVRGHLWTSWTIFCKVRTQLTALLPTPPPAHWALLRGRSRGRRRKQSRQRRRHRKAAAATAGMSRPTPACRRRAVPCFRCQLPACPSLPVPPAKSPLWPERQLQVDDSVQCSVFGLSVDAAAQPPLRQQVVSAAAGATPTHGLVALGRLHMHNLSRNSATRCPRGCI